MVIEYSDVIMTSQVLQSTIERTTLKTRMIKLGVRSIRAPPLVRSKFIESYSLPSYSTVCHLLLLKDAESLVRSFHLPVPQVIYETFLKSPFSTVSMCVLYFWYVGPTVYILKVKIFIES